MWASMAQRVGYGETSMEKRLQAYIWGGRQQSATDTWSPTQKREAVECSLANCSHAAIPFPIQCLAHSIFFSSPSSFPTYLFLLKIWEGKVQISLEKNEEQKKTEHTKELKGFEEVERPS